MIRTLIVDESPVVRSIIRDFLERDSNFIVVGEAGNGREGVELAEQYTPDLITMDIEMPLMNGLDATGLIREKNINSVIVVISTHDTAKMAYDATAKGAHEFYSKDIFTSKMTSLTRWNILSTLKEITGKKKTSAGADISQRAVIEREK
ncbi:MAG: response regulator [Treponema sp.]|jgi:two-component system chemotaxis response regulator CheB|nr:response regulator [Treponema sp.]